MLDFKIGKVVRYYITHLKFKAFIEINGKRLEKSLDLCEKEQLPALVANSVPLMWTNLMDLKKKRGKTYSMSPGFKVQTGGGGWSGTKGTVMLGQAIDKAEFLEKIGEFFNIPVTNFADAFGRQFPWPALASALDFMAIALTQLGGIAERRIDRLVNPLTSELPPFLAAHRAWSQVDVGAGRGRRLGLREQGTGAPGIGRFHSYLR